MKKDSIRIIDVAKEAGVSAGTVDRVLHNRGRVSEEAKQKVQQAIEKLGFKRNKIASALALKKDFSIVVVTPDYKNDLYWKEVQNGITSAIKRFEDFGIRILQFQYDLFDIQSFNEAIQQALKEKFNGFLLAPQFTEASLEALKTIYNRDSNVVLINTYLESPHYNSYIGQNSFQSGLLAARLLSSTIAKENARYVILDISEHVDKAYHYEQKIAGFKQFFKSNNKITIQQKNITSLEPLIIEKELLKTLINQPDGLFVTNSRAHIILDILKKELHNTKIVGFDLVEPNIHYLKQGKIQFLINQNAFLQGYLGINNLAQSIIFKQKQQPLFYLPLDIVTAENYAYYIHNERYFEHIL